ncbi:hypothetical protein [Aeromicrobium wangtongii]|uniref:WXG100 family type VII secretion target n=1 Tax=Aeromicrobium wangtongii TaxID=2969247 RepID=A0ABY5MAI1_9ACTN|nr:hypothetical protein [Aeromicrobium wangtongii]MCD9199317.1 hypothetical protein [Aeromicrobium wangtongii]UUP13678.1 hypothetical protein NQV15_17785 [Aeromicrobium wangtongii]
MTARSGEWHLVGRDGDPVPASEHDVDVVAREMASRATAAGDVKDVLSALAKLDGWKGDAAEVFAQKAEEVLDNLGKVVDRYESVAEALTSWATEVGTARTDTRRALQDAEAAQQTIDTNPETTPVPGEELTPDQESANTRRENAQADLTAACTALNNAMHALDAAADRAKNSIEDAADKWDDGRFAGLKNWIREHADIIDLLVTILEVISIIVGVVLFIAVVFFTAPVWLVVAAVAVAAAVLVGVTMLAAADTGKRDWKDVGMAAIGLALTVGGMGLTTLAAKGLTRLVPQVASRVGTAAANATRAAWAQRLSTWQAFQNASRIANPANNLARWAAGVRGNMGAAIQAADDAGRATVEALGALPTTRVTRLLTQDAGLAQSLTTLRSLKNLGLHGDELAQATRLTAQINAAIAANLSNLGLMIEQAPGTLQHAVDVAHHPTWTTRP